MQSDDEVHGMSSAGNRTRFAILLSVGLVLIASGYVARNEQERFIRGGENDAGGRETSLIAATTGVAMRVVQQGIGPAIRASSDAQGGVGGWFTSVAGTGVVALSSNAGGFAVDGANDAPTAGPGGGMRTRGGRNPGLVAESSGASAVMATAPGAGAGGTPMRTAAQTVAGAPDCVGLPCTGTLSAGEIGVMAGTGTSGGVGVHASDQTTDRSGFAVVANGDTIVDGSLTVSGGCIGCASLLVARNGSDRVLHQGEAVSLLSLDQAPNGDTVLVVGPAARGDAVVGVIDRAVSHAVPVGPASVRGGWRVWGVDVGAGESMRIASDGMLTMDGALAGVDAGEGVAVGAEPGRLVVAGGRGAGARLGTYLGVRPDGRGVLLIDLD